jgi:hypothetical protein
LFAFFIFQGKRYLTETLIITATIYLGAKHIRHTIFLGIVFGAFLPVILTHLWGIISEKQPFINRLTWITPYFL